MYNSFFVAMNAVVPFLCYLALGYAIRSTKNVDADFLKRLNQMVFKVMFPCMTFYNIYKAESDNAPSIKLIVFCGAAILVLEGILLLIVPRLVKENAKRGVIIQGIYRSNFVLFGLPLTVSLFGDEAASVAAMLITVVISIYNFTSVIILEIFNGNSVISPLYLLKRLVQNPLLQGCMVGFVFYILHIRLPECLDTPIAAFANMTSPLAIFILGGTLEFKAIRKNLKYLIPTLGAKLILMPMFMIGTACLIGLRGVELFLVLAVSATPVAASSYPMAQNMGGDGELAGQLVFISTVISIFTLFIWIFLLKEIGLI
ncbi:MAG: AEC family transporter [Lachnospiraceae bacterium]|nr:AEC family transporter [Lachnospiraceae bacterium]